MSASCTKKLNHKPNDETFVITVRRLYDRNSNEKEHREGVYG